MIRFLLSRILQGIVVVLSVLVITFLIMKAAPGDPFMVEGKQIPAAIKQRRIEQRGLDKPLPVQVWRHLVNFVTFHLPTSKTFEGIGVDEIIAQAFPVSLSIGLPALGLALLIGVPLGALAAVKPNTLQDRSATVVATVGICLPSLVLGPLMALVFGSKLRWFNVAGWHDSSDWVLPATTLGIIYSAYIARLMRGGLRETLVQDFIRTARAKGASEPAIVFRHALKLACLPVLNFLGPAAAGLLTGSFIIETVFQIPGLGQHFVSSALHQDYELAMATAAFYAALIVVFNIIVDILQAILNPRIGYKT